MRFMHVSPVTLPAMVSAVSLAVVGFSVVGYFLHDEEYKAAIFTAVTSGGIVLSLAAYVSFHHVHELSMLGLSAL